MIHRRKDRGIRQKILERFEKGKDRPPSPAMSGYGIWSARDNTHSLFLPYETGNFRDGGEFHFGAVGDMHLCSKLCNEGGVKEYFKRLQEEHGVRRFFSAGDQIDGMFIYPEQHLHLKVVGIDEQVDYATEFLDKCLRKGDLLFIVNGNHELGGKTGVYQKYGVDPAQLMQEKLPDKIRYLRNRLGGNMYARCMVTPRIAVDLVHTRQYVGLRSAPEYTLMKLIDGYRVDEQPDILLVNHTHKTARSHYRDVFAYLCGGFEFPNNYIARLSQGAKQGSFYIKVRTDNQGRIAEVSEQFVQVYRGI